MDNKSEQSIGVLLVTFLLLILLFVGIYAVKGFILAWLVNYVFGVTWSIKTGLVGVLLIQFIHMLNPSYNKSSKTE